MTEEPKEGFQEYVLSDEEEGDFLQSMKTLGPSPIAAKALNTLTETTKRRASYMDLREPDHSNRDVQTALPNSDTFLRLTSYQSSDFQTKWATVIFLCNLYNFIAAPLYVGLTYQPTGLWFALEVATELILFLDMLTRVLLNRTQSWQHMWMLHDSESWRFRCFRLVVSSLPYSIIICAVEQHPLSDTDEMGLSLMRLMKLMRGPQLLDFCMSMELISRSGQLSLLKVLKLVVVLLGLTHLGAVFYLIVNRLESAANSINTWNDLGGYEFLQYVNGWFWSTCTMTGVGFGDIVPKTNLELLTTILVMIAGASFYAAIFGQMVCVMHRLHQQNIENFSNMKQAIQWAKERKLGSAMVDRIHSYYSLVREHYQHVSNSKFLDQLPLSLRTEISMFLHEDLIQNVKIFEMGDPSFILAMVRHLMARIYTEGDFIIRRGDIAEEFFFMQHGSAKVLATDESTVIAVMGEGSFFGEIGLLLQPKRSASVKALTSVLASSISKEYLVAILKNFPDQEAFLIRIGRQRQRTTKPEDVNIAFPLSLGVEECPVNSVTIKIPQSLFSRVSKYMIPMWLWTALVHFVYLYNLVYVPMAIAFDFRLEGGAITWDALMILINIVDIVRRLRRGDVQSYMNTMFMYDFVSCLPVDYAVYALQNSILEANICMVISLIRGHSVSHIVWAHPQLKLLAYFLILTIYYHISACVFFIIAKVQQSCFSDTLPDGKTWFTIYDSESFTHFGPIEDLPVTQQYVLVMYLILQTLGDAHGPNGPQTPVEKLTIFTIMILSKCYMAFIYAEAATLISFSHELYTHHLQQVTVVSAWMHHLKLPLALQHRVNRYYDMLWLKLKGYHDSEIMNDFPESLRTDVAAVLFSSFAKCDLFNTNDEGAMLAIIRRCKVTMACAGEAIISEGELGLEMYFVLDGQVEVISKLGVVLATLSASQPFGEMALLSPVPTVRMASVIAKTDVSLAVLSLDDFRLVMASYPEFGAAMIEKAEARLVDSKIKTKRACETPPPHDDIQPVYLQSSPSEADDSEMCERYSPISAPVISTFNPSIQEQELQTARSLTAGLSQVNRPIKMKMYTLLFAKTARYITSLVLIATVYNIIFLPIAVAFQVEFDGVILGLEVLTLIIFTGYLIIDRFSQERMGTLHLTHRVLVTFPFAMVFSNVAGVPVWVYTALALIRITDLSPLFRLFHSLKARNCNWVNFLRVLEVLCYYLLLCHILSCIFISISLIEGQTVTEWLQTRMDPAPAPNSVNPSGGGVYVFGIFWACLQISHRGVGNIVTSTVPERAFSCVLMLLFAFVHAMLFGNFASLVTSLSSQLKSKLHRQYRIVMEVITKKGLSKHFIKQINDYFTYIWNTNQGLSENEILEKLPVNLLTDIQLARYASVLFTSIMFKDPRDSTLNTELTKSILRVMKVRHYLMGDSVLNAGDKGNEMFILLHGEVQVVSMEGKRILATLKPGAHFGEANLLFPWTIRRTATVMCSSLVTVGALEAKYVDMLLEAYPDWKRMMTQVSYDRLKDTFQSEDIEAMKTHLNKISTYFKTNTEYNRQSSKCRRSLIAPQLAGLLAAETVKPSYWVEIIHLGVIAYTCATIPLVIGFRLDLSPGLIALEAVCLIESLIFMLKNLRPRVFFESRKVWGAQETLSYYYHNGLFEDILTATPFFLIFELVEQDESWLIVLQVLRLFSVFRVQAILERIELHHRSLSRSFQVCRTLFFLGLLLHWSTCGWNYITSGSEKAFSWFFLLGLENTSLAQQYLYSSYYTLSYVSAVAYGDMVPDNTAERLATLCLVIAGDALFGVAFGMMAELAITAETKYSNYLKELKSSMDYLAHYSLSTTLISRLEQYYAYRWAVTEEIGLTNLSELYAHLPANLVEKIMYESNKSIIRQLPILNKYGSDSLIQVMSTKLRPEIYLPHDYVIYQNDIGEEMYFIVEGVVDVLAANDQRVITQLQKGEFLGEVALITESRRTCSVIANTFCLLYTLHKVAFQEILEDYPEIKALIQEEGNKRVQDMRTQRRNRKSVTLGSTIEASELSNDEFYNMFGWSMVNRDQMRKRMASKS